MKRNLIAMFALLLTASCGTPITSAGQRVKYVTKSEAPPECQMIDSVSHDGAFECEPSVTDAQNALRNKTADMGGNFLVIDVVIAQNTENGTCYKSTGRAFSCGNQ